MKQEVSRKGPAGVAPDVNLRNPLQAGEKIMKGRDPEGILHGYRRTADAADGTPLAVIQDDFFVFQLFLSDYVQKSHNVRPKIKM